jgi:outer membrane protein OmpA-like peptidoglycan-associated protein
MYSPPRAHIRPACSTCLVDRTIAWGRGTDRGTLLPVSLPRIAVSFGVLAGLWALPAAAAPEVGGKLGGKGGLTSADKGLSARTDRPWIERWAPERNTLELGGFAGLVLPPRDLELFRPTLSRPRQGFQPFRKVGLDVGGRLGYFPIRHFGVELEGAFMPTVTADTEPNLPVRMWAARGHLVGQLGLYSVVPFVLVGGGALGVRSGDVAVGNDTDPSLHIGLGVKAHINRRITVRLDLRDTISPRLGLSRGVANTVEALVGLSITLGRKRDRDEEKLPPEPEPTAPGDRDGDGFADPDDKCPDTPGIAPDGCPAGDRDGDGFADPDDKCPDDAGIAPDGCPDRDPDKDGILDPDDMCPSEPETVNNYEDTDGCPDEVPDEVRAFEGTLAGVNFDLGKATLQRGSQTTLDKAVEVLKKYPDVRVEISGHTDSTGSRDLNMDLSARRADTVKQYLVEHGVDASRITTRGAGPDEPLETNATKPGRAQNRRIEFRVLN